MSHFGSQLQNCSVEGVKPEVTSLGVYVFSQGGSQDLHLGADAGLVGLDVAVGCGGLVSADLNSRGTNINVMVSRKWSEPHRTCHASQ